MITKTATLKLVNETKGALKFSEVDASGAETVELMGTLYLRKSAFAGKPASITVTINVPV
jgi:hypothetical protein